MFSSLMHPQVSAVIHVRLTHPVDRTNQLNIVQSLDQIRLFDDIGDAFHLRRNAPIAHYVVKE